MKRLALFLFLLVAATSFAGTASLPSARVLFLASGSPSSGTNEVQTITFGSGQSSGTFFLRFNNSTTPAITWSATNNTLRDNIDTALESLNKIGTGGVTTAVDSMTAGIGTMTVTFTGTNSHKDVTIMTVPSKTTSGTIAVTETTPGVAADGRDAPAGTLLIALASGNLYYNATALPSPTWTLINAAP